MENGPGSETIKVALDLITAELSPLAASFFGIVEGQIRTSVVAGSHLPPARLASTLEIWKSRLAGFDPLAPPLIEGLSDRIATTRYIEELSRRPIRAGTTNVYRQIGAVNDVRMLIRDGSRLVAGVTLWRRFGQDVWSPPALRFVTALQPLVETAYLASLGMGAGEEGPWPAGLTRRQRQVARLLAGGASNAEVARALQISQNTAKSHTRRVLALARVSSRRQLPLRFPAASREAISPVLPRQRRRLPASIEGDDPARRLLAAALDWSVERLGARAAGCLVLSARRQPVSGAWSSASEDPVPTGPSPARVLQLMMLHPARVAAMMRAAESPSGPLVLPTGSRLPGADEERRLVAAFGFGRPLVMALRDNGRIAALVWICRDAGADPAGAEPALRAAQPLLQLALCGALTEFGQRSSSWALEAAARGLTPREDAVGRLVLEGDGNARIAERLGIAESTVKKHMTRILKKCDVRSRAQLIALLGDRG